MSGLPREVIRWLQSLDLTWQVKTPKWDLTNGYLVAEIFSWYYPQEIEMHMFNTGTSLDFKQRNWDILQKFIKRHKLDIPEDYIDNTIHCKEGAAQLLIEKIYEILTNRKARRTPMSGELDFSDRQYQLLLPMHARSTASQSVKNNLRNTEIMADRNLILGQQKAQTIINSHIDHRLQERHEDPHRFNRKPTLGELAERRLPDSTAVKVEHEDSTLASSQPHTDIDSVGLQRETSVQFKEVNVQQMARVSAGGK